MSDNPFAEPEDSDRTAHPAGSGFGRLPNFAISRRHQLRHPHSPPRLCDAAARPRAGAAARTACEQPYRALPATATATDVEPSRHRCCPAGRGGGAAAATAGPPRATPSATCLPIQRRPAGAHGQRMSALRIQARPATPGRADGAGARRPTTRLCASLDDVVLNTSLGQRAAVWATHSLVSTFHQEVRSGERFFDLLKPDARQNPGTMFLRRAGADVPVPGARASSGATGCPSGAPPRSTRHAGGNLRRHRPMQRACGFEPSCRRIGPAWTRPIVAEPGARAGVGGGSAGAGARGFGLFVWSSPTGINTEASDAL